MFERLETLFYVLIVLTASFVFTTGNDLKVGKDDREAHSDRSGLWFGPRLGKRSAHISEDNRDVLLRLIEAADALKFYYNQIPDSYLERRNEPEIRAVTKKVIFTPKLGRSLEDQRNYVEFTPRLGRRLTEEFGITPSIDQDVSDGDRLSGRERFFSPRLGRTMSFSPRLGREIYDNYPEKIRLTRSANDTKTNKR